MEKVSVIVPVYRVEQYIDKCVESIVNQTYTNLEIILVDDGSPDNCPQICDEWAKKDNRIKVIHKKNGGLSDARNAGFRIATGTFCAFIDSDDYIEINMFEEMCRILLKDNSDIVICGIRFVDEEGNEGSVAKDLETGVFSKKEIFKKFTEDNWWQYVSACTKLYRKDVIDNIEFPKGKLNEDAFVMHEFFDRCKKISVTNKKFYHYVQSDNSITRSNITIRNLDEFEAIYNRYCFYINNGYSDYVYGIRKLLIDKYFKIFSRLKIKNTKELKRYFEIKKMIKRVMDCDLSSFNCFCKMHIISPLMFGVLYRIKNGMR